MSRRLQIELEPEQRCEQFEEREFIQWLEASAYGLPQENQTITKEKKNDTSH